MSDRSLFEPNFTYSASPIYTWQGEIQAESEWQLVIKTDLAKFEALKTKVQELHSYEVPEIIAIPIIAGSDAYLNWLGQSLSL